MYEKPTTNNKVHLMRKLLNLKINENSFVAHHLNLFSDIVNQLDMVEMKFDDEVKVFIMRASLPNTWEPMQAVVGNLIEKRS